MNLGLLPKIHQNITIGIKNDLVSVTRVKSSGIPYMECLSFNYE
jgi:hypothetical protein